jgi:hypothetical protein
LGIDKKEIIMANKKFNNATKVNIKGKNFNSIIEACRYFRICRTTVQGRMANNGMTIEDAILNTVRKRVDPKRYEPTKKGLDYYLYSFKVGVI